MGLLKNIGKKVESLGKSIERGVKEHPMAVLGGIVGLVSPGAGIASGLYFVGGELHKVRKDIEKGLVLAEDLKNSAQVIEKRLGELVQIGSDINNSLLTINSSIQSLSQGVKWVAEAVSDLADELSDLGNKIDGRFDELNSLIISVCSDLSAQFREDLQAAFYKQALQDGRAALAAYKSVLSAVNPDGTFKLDEKEMLEALKVIEHDMSQAIFRMLGFSTFGLKAFVTTAPLFCVWGNAYQALELAGLRGPFCDHDLTKEVAQRTDVFLNGYCAMYEHTMAHIPLDTHGYIFREHSTNPDWTPNFNRFSKIPYADLYLTSELVNHLMPRALFDAPHRDLLVDLKGYLRSGRNLDDTTNRVIEKLTELTNARLETSINLEVSEPSEAIKALRVLAASDFPTPSLNSFPWKKLIDPDIPNPEIHLMNLYRRQSDPNSLLADLFDPHKMSFYAFNYLQGNQIPILNPNKLKSLSLPRYAVAKIFGDFYQYGDPDDPIEVWGWRKDDKSKWHENTQMMIDTASKIEDLSLARIAIRLALTPSVG